MTSAPDWISELNQLIAMGWGDTPRHLIPPDWRTRRGPDGSFTSERKANIATGVGRKRWGWGSRGQKVPALAAQKPQA